MGDVTLTQAWLWLLAGAGGIITLSNAWKIIKKFLHPEQDLREWREVVDKKLDNDFLHMQKLDKASRDNHEFLVVLSRATIAQINHELSGNDVEHLRGARDEITELLIRR